MRGLIRLAGAMAVLMVASALVAVVQNPPANAAVDVILEVGDDFQAAVDANPPGTQFLIRAGVHRFQSVIPKSDMVFVGEPGAVMSGGRILQNWNTEGPRWWVGGQTQQGGTFGICESAFPRCNYHEDLFIDDVPMKHVATKNEVGPGEWFFDYGADRIYIGDNPAGRVVETSVTPIAFDGSASNVVIRDLVIEKYAAPAQDGAISGTDWTVERVEARFNHGSGVRVEDGGIVRDGFFHTNGQQGINTSGAGVLVEGNEIAWNNFAHFELDWEGGGTKFALGPNAVIRNNWSHDNYGPGLWVDVFGVDVLMEGNVTERNYRSGLFFEVSNGGTIRNNYTEANGLDDPRSGWYWGAGILVPASLNVEVYGNTVVNNGNGITGVQQRRGDDAPWGQNCLQNLNVHDNIVTMNRGKTGAAQDYSPPDPPHCSLDIFDFGTANNRFENNTYYLDNVGASRFGWDGPTHSFSGWQAFGHDDTGSVSPITFGPPTWTGGTVIASQPTPTSVALGWSGASDTEGIGAYRIYEASLGQVGTTAGATSITIYRLAPGGTYTFSVEAVDVMGNESATGPSVSVPNGSSAFDTTFAIFGDYGDASQSEADVAALVASLQPDWIATTGDNLYSPGTYDSNVGQFYATYIGDYSGAYGPGAATNMFFPAIGNHDYTDPAGGIGDYLTFFTLPGTGTSSTNTSGNERYYDVIQGPIHLFVVNSDIQEPDGITAASVQAQWLQVQLAASTAPWQVVVLHHPPFSSSSQNGSDPTLQWPFGAWGADAVLAGHDHTYERLDVSGTPYFVSGLGGHSIHPFGAPLPQTEFRYNDDYGTMLVRACNAGMEFEFHSVTDGLVDGHAVGAPCQDPDPPPLPPSGLTASGTVPNTIDLAWVDNSADELSFELDVSTAGVEGPWTALASVAAGVTSYADTATPGLQQCYRVRAVNAAGASPYTNVACGVAPADTTAPWWDGGVLTVTGVTVDSIALAWSGATDDVGVVDYVVSQDGNPVLTTPATSALITDLDPATSYLFGVEAVDAALNQSTDGPTTVATTADPGRSVALTGGDGVTVAGGVSGLAGDLTLEAWVRWDDGSVGRSIVASTYLGEGEMVIWQNGQLAFYHGDGTNFEGFGSLRLLEPGVWTHVVVTRDAANVSWFVNGVLTDQRTPALTPASLGTDFKIGLGTLPGLVGGIDEVAVYDRALSSGEVAEHFTSLLEGDAQSYGEVVLADAPVSYWRFNETAGPLAGDETGANDGTYTGSPAFEQPGAVAAVPPAGSVTFDRDAAVGVPNAPALQIVGDLTFEGWVWWDDEDTSVGRSLFGKSYLHEGQVVVWPNGQLGFYHGDGQNYQGFISSALLSPGQWTHLAVTREAGLVTWYVNGQPTNSIPMDPLVTPASSPFDVRLGWRPLALWDGGLDEVAVYDRALSAAEIAEHHGLIADPSAYETSVVGDGPVAYWRLDDPVGVFATDRMASHHGIYLGSPQYQQPPAG